MTFCSGHVRIADSLWSTMRYTWAVYLFKQYVNPFRTVFLCVIKGLTSKWNNTTALAYVLCQNQEWTRQHSSGMHTPQDVSNGWVGPQVNKFKKISIDDHQMSVAGEGVGLHVEGVPYRVSYPMMHVMYLSLSLSPWIEWPTDICENITFPQLCLRVVKLEGFGRFVCLLLLVETHWEIKTRAYKFCGV